MFPFHNRTDANSIVKVVGRDYRIRVDLPIRWGMTRGLILSQIDTIKQKETKNFLHGQFVLIYSVSWEFTAGVQSVIIRYEMIRVQGSLWHKFFSSLHPICSVVLKVQIRDTKNDFYKWSWVTFTINYNSNYWWL